MKLDRPFYIDIDYHPYLFYVVLGASLEDKFEVLKDRHHVDGFPEGLEFFYIDRENDSEYMDNMMGGTIGSILMEENPELYLKVKGEHSWAIIRGEVKDDTDLTYMRNVIGYIQALVERGGKAVFDFSTVTLYSPIDWRKRFFQPEFSPCDHIRISSSIDRRAKKPSMWIHTRGMSKYGRPDISFENVPEGKENMVINIIRQMIYFSAQGAFYTKPAKFHFNAKHAGVVTPVFQNDFENEVFNNAFYKIDWNACEFN